MTHPSISADHVQFRVRVVEWLVERLKDPSDGYFYSAARLTRDQYLVVEDGPASFMINYHLSFEDLINGKAGNLSCDYPNAFALAICRKLDVREFEGHDVEKYFGKPYARTTRLG